MRSPSACEKRVGVVVVEVVGRPTARPSTPARAWRNRRSRRPRRSARRRRRCRRWRARRRPGASQERRWPQARIPGCARRGRCPVTCTVVSPLEIRHKRTPARRRRERPPGAPRAAVRASPIDRVIADVHCDSRAPGPPPRRPSSRHARLPMTRAARREPRSPGFGVSGRATARSRDEMRHHGARESVPAAEADRAPRARRRTCSHRQRSAPIRSRSGRRRRRRRSPA